MNATRRPSIASRLTFTFAAATAIVVLVTGAAILYFQSIELRRYEHDDLHTRLTMMASTIFHAREASRWVSFTDRMTSFTPEDDSVRFIVDGPDPRFNYGRTWPADASILRNDDGSFAVDFADRSFLAMSSVVPALGERPAVVVTVATDRAGPRRTRAILALAVSGMTLVSIAVVSVLAWAIARRSLRPLEHLSRHATSLNPDDPGLRLPDDALPAELTSMTVAFNGALERLEVAYARLSRFNADVAHELRTPLGNLIGQTEVALSRSRSADELGDVLQSNLEDLERLRHIINDMLFLARADQGAMARHRVPRSLAELTRHTAEFLEPLFEEAELALEIEGDARIAVEPALFSRAVTNLLVNAIRHGSGTGPVRVFVEDEPRFARFSVSNPAAPIETADLDTMFDRFHRLDPSRESSDGESHGLGLAIVKAIATMHGGTVFASCEDGEIRVGFTVDRGAEASVSTLVADQADQADYSSGPLEPSPSAR